MTSWSVSLRRDGRRPRRGSNAAAKRQEFVIEDSLGYLVNAVARSMAHQLADALRPMGVGIGQWAVLLVLWAQDGLSQAELSRVVAIEPPTMVRTLDRMVRDGLVTREPDPVDARISRIHVTVRGRSLRDALLPKAAAVNAANLGRLTATEGRTLRQLLGKLLAAPPRNG